MQIPEIIFLLKIYKLIQDQDFIYFLYYLYHDFQLIFV